MYDELVKRLRHDSESRALMVDAADAIEELSREYGSIAVSLNESVELVRKLQQPRWIPVTERLPEERKWVLCRCEANIIEVLRWENNEWYHDPMHVYYPSFVARRYKFPAGRVTKTQVARSVATSK